MVNLGVHQSSSVSVLGNTEYFSTDLQRSDGVWLTAELWKTPPGWYLPEAEGVWLCPCDFVSPSITVMECLARCRCLGNHLQMLSPSFQRDPPTERPCPSNGCKNKEIHKWVLAFITYLLQQELRNSLAELIFSAASSSWKRLDSEVMLKSQCAGFCVTVATKWCIIN